MQLCNLNGSKDESKINKTEMKGLRLLRGLSNTKNDDEDRLDIDEDEEQR